jgi:hypothetical protein
MFFYSEWLQTSPPLFLLLSRAALLVLGLSDTAFRVVPLALALIGVAAMFRVSARVLSLPWAVLAAAIVAFHPAAIEYSRSAKQYSGELAATALVLLFAVRYVQEPSPKALRWLAAIVLIAQCLAYPIALVMPGVLLAAYRVNAKTAIALGAAWGAELTVLWLVFIRPNTAPALRAFWAASSEPMFTPILIGAAVFAAIETVRALIAWKPIALMCALPCVLLAVANVAGWYPASARMRLWVFPCFVLLLLVELENLARAILKSERIGAVLAVAAALFFAIAGIRGQISQKRYESEEDLHSAFRYLKQHVTPRDLVLVHAAAREGFMLYAVMDGWQGPAPNFGSTGWPCCARNRDARPRISIESAAIQDLDRMIPDGFKGRIWLYYPTRPSHWDYVGLDEGALWRNYTWQKGCPPDPYIALKNLALSPMNCAGRRGAPE